MAGYLRRHQQTEMLPQSSLVFNAVPLLRIFRVIAPANLQRCRRQEEATSDGCAGLGGSPPPALRPPGVPAVTGCPWGSPSTSTSASLPMGPPSQGCGLDQEAGGLLPGPKGSDKITEFLLWLVGISGPCAGSQTRGGPSPRLWGGG